MTIFAVLLLVITAIATPISSQPPMKRPAPDASIAAREDDASTVALVNAILARFDGGTISQLDVGRKDGRASADLIRSRVAALKEQRRSGSDRSVAVTYERAENRGDTVSYIVQESNHGGKVGSTGSRSTYTYWLVPEGESYRVVGRFLLSSRDSYRSR